MYFGILLVFITGLSWSAVGVVYSHVARHKLDLFAVKGVQTLLGAVFAWVFIADWPALLRGDAIRLGELALVMLGSGLLNGVGVIAMQKAMRAGHHGIVWTMGQSAMVLPFAYGVLFFGEAAPLRRCAGVALVLGSLVLFGLKRRSVTPVKGEASGAWFPLALLTLLLLGSHQSLATTPAHWQGWEDAARMRVPFATLGIALCYVAPTVARRAWPNRKTLGVGLVLLGIGVPTQLIFYTGMDALRAHKMVSLAYPLAVGTCIVVFALYSALVLKERKTPASLAGIALGIGGLALISL